MEGTMPLFHIDKNKLTTAKLINFAKEKDIQSLIENNLAVVFNCKFIASEFSTGSGHGGRIDTLALSEDYNPVIIEYQKIASSELVNQSLYYLSWIKEHKGDFQIAVNKYFRRNGSIKKIYTNRIRKYWRVIYAKSSSFYRIHRKRIDSLFSIASNS
jgi:hypothetical protein